MKAGRALTRSVGRATRVTARATTAALVEPAGGASTGMRLLGALIVCVIPAVALALGGLIPSLVAAFIAAAVVARRLTLMRGRSWASGSILGHAPRALLTWQGITATALVAAAVVAVQLRFLPELAVPYVVLVALVAVLLCARRGHAKGIAKVMRATDAAAAALRVPVSELEGRVHRRRDERGRAYIVISNAPAKAIDYLRQRPAAVDASLAAVLGDVEASVHGRSIHITPASEETVERRRLAASSGGLVLAVLKAGAEGRRELTLVDDISPAAVTRVDAWARRELGAVVVDWRPFDSRGAVAEMSDEEVAMRARAAALIRGAEPHHVEVQVTGVQGGRTFTVNSHALLALNAADRARTARDIRETIPGHQPHWLVRTDGVSGTITIIERDDPLARTVPYPADAAPTLERIPFGVDENGDVVSLALIESNALIGGIPGSGKSGTSTAVLTGISKLEHVALIGLDPKRVELGPWGPRFSAVAKGPGEQALHVLEALEAEMRRRNEWLDDRGLKKISRREVGPDLPLLVLVIDELADLVAPIGGREQKAMNVRRGELIERLISLGRAAGVVVITMTQKPSAKLIPTELRDNIAQRIAQRTKSPTITDIILGDGMAALAPAHEITGQQKGVGYVANEDTTTAVRARSFWVPDDAVAGLAAATAHLRVELPWLAEAMAEHVPAPTLGDIIPGTAVTQTDDAIEELDLELDLGDLDLGDDDAEATSATSDEWSDVDPAPAPTGKPPQFTW